MQQSSQGHCVERGAWSHTSAVARICVGCEGRLSGPKQPEKVVRLASPGPAGTSGRRLGATFSSVSSRNCSRMRGSMGRLASKVKTVSEGSSAPAAQHAKFDMSSFSAERHCELVCTHPVAAYSEAAVCSCTKKMQSPCMQMCKPTARTTAVTHPARAAPQSASRAR